MAQSEAPLDRFERLVVRLERLIERLEGRTAPPRPRPGHAPGHAQECTCEECFPT